MNMHFGMITVNKKKWFVSGKCTWVHGEDMMEGGISRGSSSIDWFDTDSV